MFSQELFQTKMDALSLFMKQSPRGELDRGIEVSVIDELTSIYQRMAKKYADDVRQGSSFPAQPEVAQHPEDQRLFHALLDLLERMELDFTQKFIMDFTHDLTKEVEIGKIKIAFLDGVRRNLNHPEFNKMEALTILKSLSDESRLAIYRLLLERSVYIEVIAERLKLAPSTVSFHLKKLSEAGLVTSYRDQYYTIYSANSEPIEMSLKDLVLGSGALSVDQDKTEDQYKQKVLKSFFKYGKLVKIPSQKKKREWVLKKILESFQPHKAYPLVKAKQMLGEIHDDPSSLLRELQNADCIRVIAGNVYLRKS